MELTYPYFIARFPVSVAQWLECRRPENGEIPDGSRRDNEPVVNVSWREAVDFCAALTDRWRNQLPVGWSVCLPSEAEWEKAARGGMHVPERPLVVEVSEVIAALSTRLAVTANDVPARTYPYDVNAGAGENLCTSDHIRRVLRGGSFVDGAEVRQVLYQRMQVLSDDGLRLAFILAALDQGVDDADVVAPDKNGRRRARRHQSRGPTPTDHGW